MSEQLSDEQLTDPENDTWTPDYVRSMIAEIRSLRREILHLRRHKEGTETVPDIKELGCAGHLIVAGRCRWKRHTQVGLYRISSIGDYYPETNGPRDTVGCGDNDFFETMVFLTTGAQDRNNEGCGCYEVTDWGDIECRRYATAGDAQKGHEELIEKYAGMQ